MPQARNTRRLGIGLGICSRIGLRPRRPAGAGRTPARAESTLSTVKARGQLLRHQRPVPGFSVQDEHKEWAGLEIDYCRSFTPRSWATAARSVRAAHHRQPLRRPARPQHRRADAQHHGIARRPRTGVRDVTVIYIDAQTVVVPKTLNVKELTELDGKTVCSCATRPISRGGRNGSPNASARSAGDVRHPAGDVPGLL